MNQELDNVLERICNHDLRYKRDAYEFVLEALSFTQKKLNRPKHVTGKELLDGIKDLLLSQYGPMTLSVLDYWGVKNTEGFGQIVFNLVSNRILSRTEDDTMGDFKSGYDFKETFNVSYHRQLEKKISRMRSF